jgi:hypothetical protein
MTVPTCLFERRSARVASAQARGGTPEQRALISPPGKIHRSLAGSAKCPLAGISHPGLHVGASS